VPQDLVELYATPYVKAETEGEATYAGHGLWVDLKPDGHPEVYMAGGDAGVSFWSSMQRHSDRQVTLLSNTSHGAWAVLRDIKKALKALDGLAA